MHIPFNLPHLTGKEAHYMYQAVYNGKQSGNGEFTKRCQCFFEEKYGFKKCLLTTRCADALEVKDVLCNLSLGNWTFFGGALDVFLRNIFWKVGCVAIM